MKMTEEKIQEELRLISNKNWPHWPLLPMVNREKEEAGLIVAGDDLKTPAKLYPINIFELHEKGIQNLQQLREKVKPMEFPSMKDMILSGWVVD